MEWRKEKPGKYAEIRGMDPRAEWLLDDSMGRHDYLPDDRLVSFIMRVDVDSADVLQELKKELRSDSSPILVPSFYFEPRDRIDAGEYFAAMAPRSFFEGLARGEHHPELHGASKHIQLGLPLRTASLPDWEPGKRLPQVEPPPRLTSHKWPAGTVVIGIIDDGIAFAHQRFRDAESSTRVEYFWQQDGAPEPGAPRTVDYGKEICKRSRGGIDELLRESRQRKGLVDEEEVYRRSGLLDFSQSEHKAIAWRSAHGTHVLDLVAGEDWKTGDPEAKRRIATRPIIAVQLPVATTADTSGAGLEPHVLDGIEYILHRASLLAGDGEPLPVVINFSYGTNSGPHDGSSPLERSMDRLIRERTEAPLRIVLPAGNANLARCHAEVKLPGSAQPEPECLNWRLLPDDRTRSILEIWLPDVRPVEEARISLSIATPDGTECSQEHRLKEGDKEVLQAFEGKHVICDARYAVVSVPADGPRRAVKRGLFRIMVQPTTRLLPTGAGLDKRVSPSGVWRVKLHDLGKGESFTVQAWIERDDTAHGYPVRGRQSYFDHACYERFDEQGRERADDPDRPCIVKRAGMISGIATGDETIVVGGYLRKEREPSSYSAGGSIARESETTAIPPIPDPVAAMVSDDSKVHAGVLAAGSRSGSVVAMRGTSVAAPRVARIVADELAGAAGGGMKGSGSKPPGSRAAIAELAKNSEAPGRSGDARAGERPPQRVGAGRLRLREPIPRWRERYVED